MVLGKPYGSMVLMTIIGVVITGVLAAAIFTTLNTWFKTQHSISKRIEAEDLRNRIRISFDCNATMAPLAAACDFPTNPEQFMDLKAATSVIFLSKVLTNPLNTVGQYQLRASCPLVGGRRQVVIETLDTSIHNPTPQWADLFPSGVVPLGCFAP